MSQTTLASSRSPSRPGILGDRNRLSAWILLLGVLGSVALGAVGARPGTVLVPFSLGVLGALAVAPFPHADRWLALGMLGTLPILPPVGLPNLPLAAGVLGIALVRVARDGARTIDRRVAIALAGLWGLIIVGAAVSNWPPFSMWARPVAILAFAALASVVGALVWTDPERRGRWLDGFAIGLLVVAVSALVVFVLQYVIPIRTVADGLIGLLGYLRGDGAAAKFEDQNNWVIWGEILTLRAFSPIFPAPTNTGGFLGLVVPLVAVRWISEPPSGWRRVAGIALLASGAVVLTSLSRSTWLAAAVAVAICVVAAVVSARLRGLVRGTYRMRVAGAAALLAAGAIVGVAGVLSVGTQAAADRITRPLEDPSVTGRITIDEDAVAAFGADMLHGAGLGNWEASLPVQNGTTYIHNVYLQYAAATGVFGLAWSVLLVALVVGAGLLLAGRAADPRLRLLGLGVLGTGVFAAVQFLFDDNLLNPQYAWILLWIVGGSVALAARAAVDRARPGTR